MRRTRQYFNPALELNLIIPIKNKENIFLHDRYSFPYNKRLNMDPKRC